MKLTIATDIKKCRTDMHLPTHLVDVNNGENKKRLILMGFEILTVGYTTARAHMMPIPIWSVKAAAHLSWERYLFQD